MFSSRAMDGRPRASSGALLFSLLFAVQLAQTQAMDFAAASALIVTGTYVAWGSLPLWICGMIFGSMGISVATQWPSPHCCCYRLQQSDRPDNGCDCVGLMASCVILLVFQGIMWLLHIVFLALTAQGGGSIVWAMIAQVLDWTTLGLLIAAIVMLKRSYKARGEPVPHIGGQHGVVIVQQHAPMAPVAPPVPQVAMGVAVAK